MGALAIACPGQGAQHSGMFDLPMQSEVAALWLAKYSDALSLDIVDVAKNNRDLFSNRYAQILVCGASVSLWMALVDRIGIPELFMGYSVGELAAYGCAGVWSAEQLADLVTKRAALMDAVTPPSAGLIAVKGPDLAVINDICGKYALEVAIVNADDHVVLGGKQQNLAAAAARLNADGQWCKILDVAVPSHTSFMSAAVPLFHEAISNTAIRPPTAPLIVGITGCLAKPTEAADALSAQLARPVRWHDCMKNAVEYGVSVVLELSPGKSLSRMFEEFDAAIESRAAEDFRTLDGIADWVRAKTSL